MDPLLSAALAAAEPFGVTLGGICPLDALSGLLHCRKAWLLPASGSILTLLLPYYTGEHPGRNVSLYAIPDDYHRVAGDILEGVADALRERYPANTFLPFVDNSPIPEVEAACRCGLGFRGKNGQLITRRYGSMAFIGEIVTDRATDCPPAEPRCDCGDCRRCLDACPTGALGESGLDKARCRSELTQKKGALTPWEQTQIKAGELAWGCDLCTLACPWNREPEPTAIPGLGQSLTPVVTPEELAGLVKTKSYGWRGRAVLERNLALLKE